MRRLLDRSTDSVQILYTEGELDKTDLGQPPSSRVFFAEKKIPEIRYPICHNHSLAAGVGRRGLDLFEVCQAPNIGRALLRLDPQRDVKVKIFWLVKRCGSFDDLKARRSITSNSIGSAGDRIVGQLLQRQFHLRADELRLTIGQGATADPIWRRSSNSGSSHFGSAEPNVRLLRAVPPATNCAQRPARACFCRRSPPC
ncbi:hypothetical protein niasHT_029177 [Heterodera trifolii]|uniref:Uncharacterized protein n=1 Tax=Heterodera trifolii TaxID=157864 RepID=A0ABD2JFR0_9BILA